MDDPWGGKMKTFLVAWLARIAQVVVLAAIVNAVLPIGFQMVHSAERASRLQIVAFGDSLTAGYLLPDSASFPSQLQQALRAKGQDVDVLNAGVSGDTTAAGLERFDWAIPEGTDGVIVELGANDALRGLDPQRARENLDTIVSRIKARGMHVLLAGMAAPRSLGEAYVEAFDSIYPDLAKRHEVLLYPFFLDGVAENPALNLDDGLHPSAQGVAKIVERILPKVEELVAQIRANKASAIVSE
jgi:acyl-CoA thioesterase-1